MGTATIPSLYFGSNAVQEAGMATINLKEALKKTLKKFEVPGDEKFDPLLLTSPTY